MYHFNIVFSDSFFSEFFCCSSSRKYLKNVHDGEGVLDYIDRLKKVPPVIWWHVVCLTVFLRSAFCMSSHHVSPFQECWHWEHYTDNDGNSKRRKRTTHEAKANYKFNSWRDASMSTDGLDEYKLTKMRLVKTFTLVVVVYFCIFWYLFSDLNNNVVVSSGLRIQTRKTIIVGSPRISERTTIVIRTRISRML